MRRLFILPYILYLLHRFEPFPVHFAILLSMATLVLLKGPAGVGKTTLAKKLHSELGWEYIARDDIKEKLVQAGCLESELGKRSYDVLWSVLEEQLTAGKSAISDTNLNQPIALKHIEHIVAQTKAKIVVLDCFCNTNIHKNRLESRKDQGLTSFWIDSREKYQAYLKSGDNQGDFAVPHPTIRVDTGKLIDVKELAKRIKAVAVV